MKITQFQDDYLGIFTRSYLIETASHNVWIDGGLLTGKEEKLPYLENGKENLLFLTHGHWDHIGCASLTQSLGGKVFIHAGDVPMVTNHDWLWEMLFGQFRGDFALPPEREPLFLRCVGENILPDRLLKNGDVFAMDDVELTVLHTPGHSPGSVCLYERKSGILFSGDSIIGNGFFRSTPQLADFDEYVASMRSLAGIRPTRVLSAHAPEITDPEAYAAYLKESVDCALRMRETAAAAAGDDCTVSSVAKAIAEEEGKGVGGGTCITALNALKCLPENRRAREILGRYIYGY